MVDMTWLYRGSNPPLMLDQVEVAKEWQLYQVIVFKTFNLWITPKRCLGGTVKSSFQNKVDLFWECDDWYVGCGRLHISVCMTCNSGVYLFYPNYGMSHHCENCVALFLPNVKRSLNIHLLRVFIGNNNKPLATNCSQFVRNWLAIETLKDIMIEI